MHPAPNARQFTAGTGTARLSPRGIVGTAPCACQVDSGSLRLARAGNRLPRLCLVGQVAAGAAVRLSSSRHRSSILPCSTTPRPLARRTFGGRRTPSPPALSREGRGGRTGLPSVPPLSSRHSGPLPSFRRTPESRHARPGCRLEGLVRPRGLSRSGRRTPSPPPSPARGEGAGAASGVGCALGASEERAPPLPRTGFRLSPE